MPNRLLTIPEAAEYLGVSDSTLGTWRYEKKGPPFVRQGRWVRYPADALEAWLKASTVTADA
ncbi:hypothetical protein GCM10009592_14290 [Brachybacterium rhamnosum]|uniref:Helix-turn-helix transcriptional regulator n=1 Tax=Brachybacterium rhamnosum TaxID=173361 RepID=A0ABW4PZW3_9MICO